MHYDDTEAVELRKNGQYEEAMNYYLGLINRDPKPSQQDVMDYSYTIAHLLYLQGEYARSFATYYQMLKSSLQVNPALMYDFLCAYYQYEGPETTFEAVQNFLVFSQNWIPHLGHLALDSINADTNSACIYHYMKRLVGADNEKTDAFKAEHGITALPTDQELEEYEKACYDKGELMFKHMMVDFIKELKPEILE